MYRIFEKTWPLLSILLTITILASLLFWPGVSRVLAFTALCLGMGAALLFTVRRSWLAYLQGQLTRSALTRNLTIDISGLLLAMGVAIYVGGWAGRVASLVVGNAIESQWPGMGTLAAVLSGLLAGACAGFGAGLLARGVWGSMVKPKRIAPKKIKT